MKKWGVKPMALELVFYRFLEHQSNDEFLNDSDDEIFIHGTAIDTSELMAGDVLPTHAINLPTGDVSDPSVNSSWISDTNPYVVYRFDLTSNPVFPRTCSVQLQVVEEDNQDLAESFHQLDEKYREKLGEKIKEAGATLLAKGGEALVPGSGPYVQAIAGVVLDALVPAALEAIANPIFEGLENERFLPEPFSLYIPSKNYDLIDRPQLFPGDGTYAEEPPKWIWTELRSRHIQTSDTHYEFVYYWKIQRETYSYNEPDLESRKLSTRVRPLSAIPLARPR